MSNTVTFVQGGTTIVLDTPEFGYTSSVKLPFDFTRLSSGLYAVYDAGSSYDIRSCECTFMLNATDTDELLQFIDTNARGLSTPTMTLSSGCGFFPFGADKGDTGQWTVAIEMLEDQGVGALPYLYHRIRVRITNQSTHPAYTPPTEVTEGSMTLGSVTGLRFPQSWFSIMHRLSLFSDTTMNGSVKFTDRTSGGDSHDNTLMLTCNESKAAALITYLVGTARTDTFTLTTASNQYAFGMRSGSSGSYTVRLLSNEIKSVHNNHNIFDIELSLSREAIL